MGVVEVWRHALAGLLLTLALGGPASAQPTIVWEVENPFRFFLDPADTEVHRATWVSLSPEQRRSPVLSSERLLAERHRGGVERLHVRQDMLGRDTQPLRLP